MNYISELNKKIKTSLNKLTESKFILAVSGGSDSQCLIYSLSHVIKKTNHKIIAAVGCNHGFRPEANDELQLAQDLCEKNNINFIKVNLNLTCINNKQKQARDARYSALRNIKLNFGADYIITAHHWNDKAETVLFRLIRGNKLGSMGVMPEISGDLYRPMLNVSKEEINKYIKFWNIKFANDPSNQNLDYTRIKIRNELIPMLKTYNPQILKRLNDLSDEISSLK
jgi:tRNA(Ile)-lysidine synthase